ncbi:MAG: hypothetical protein K5945_01510, partial [Bacteroidaceae bacterium]|nr:hypothetical protein [Bacteroidaceae bacterium]
YFKIEISASFNNGGNIQMSEFKMITPAELEAIKAAYVEEMAPFLNAVYSDDAMKLKYNAALREITNAEPEAILAAVANVMAIQEEILAAQPELAVVDGAYQIGNAGDLMTFAKMVISSSVDGEGKVSYPFATANATLTADINLASVNFNPIGSNDIKYGGTFDGQGHAIKNMNIDQPSTAFRGLFSVVENATIKQVKIVDAYVAGNENVGAVVGRAINSNIEGNAVLNSYIEGRDHAGAVAGEIRGNAGTHFADNYSDSEVYSREYQAGGMIGTILGGTVEHNLFIGTVDAGGGRSGGLIALLDGNESDVVIKNNAIFPATVDAGWGAESCYAIMMRAGRNASYENNYSLSTALYNGETFGLTNPNDENGGQVDWATSTSRAFYRDVLGFDFAQKWTMAYGGTYPTPSYITYDGPTKAKVPVTAAGYATFVAPADVDFSQVEGVQAFYVTDGGSAHKKLEPTTLVRHGEAVVVTAKVEESGETFETGSSVEGTVLTLTNGDVKPGTKTVTITTADMGLGNSEKVEGEWEFNDFTMTLSKGEGSTVPAYYTSGTAIRLYANNTVTFTGKELPIAKVVIECGNASYTGKGWAVTADDNSLELLHVATSGHIRMQTITITFADEGITVPYTAQDIAEPNADNELIAAFDDVDADGSEYVLAQKNGVVAFYQVEAGTTIPAGKGYLKTQTPGVKVYYLGTDDETGIEMAQELKGTDVQGDAAIFDLSGRRVEKLQKGIYIMNGKKVLK